jgi:peptidoglycan hydrolase FlgJ
MDLPPVGPPLQSPLPLTRNVRGLRDDAAMKQVAQEFEAAFLAEMLKYTGINSAPSVMGGDEGEDAFSALLTREYARIMATDGGIGLAEQIFEALKQRNASE